MPTAPGRTLQQRMDALGKANAIRTFRAHLKVDLKEGRVLLVDLLNNPPEKIQTMKIFDLLQAAPRFGRAKANKVLKTCRISPSRTIGALSQRQRTEMIYEIRR